MNKLKLGFILATPGFLLILGSIGWIFLSGLLGVVERFLALNLEVQIRTILALAIFIPFCVGIALIIREFPEFMQEEDDSLPDISIP